MLLNQSRFSHFKSYKSGRWYRRGKRGDPGGNGKGQPPAEETSDLSLGTVEDKDRQTFQDEDSRQTKVGQQDGRELA